MDNAVELSGYGVAIVGMAIRVPGALNPDAYWSNLKQGVESVKFYTDEELLLQGVAADLLKNPNYVKAGCPLEGMQQFDPEFFGFSPKEAGILDPQHRQFYECCWEALERAGHPPRKFDGAIGVFAGSGMAAYFALNILTNPDLVHSVGTFLLRHTGNDKDFLSSRVSYSFNLKGPSINVQTACSTSAVAVHLACQSLLNEECDMALAGGVSIDIPHGLGYLYKEGEILSPDGHCRAFDHRSKGTIFGSGTAVVVLRRIVDAIADGDHIHGVIVGSAVNNDGSNKVGYLAPSVEGQAEAITEALEMAGVDADSIGYVECHGTGTPVGDPIEVSALATAFRRTSNRTGYCGIGSVKTNIGHLDTAAGVAGLIKATLALEHKMLPPSLNFEAPNPTIDFGRTPFYVNTALKDWKAGNVPRRAAVNSLGVGGTNAFIILEEAPPVASSIPDFATNQLITFSAKNRKSLDLYGQRLAEHLKSHPNLNFADVAYSLFEGREHFASRRVLAAQNCEEAIQLLESNDARRVFTHSADEDEKSLVFMFPGGGAQYIDMSLGLYESHEAFRSLMDAGFDCLKMRTGLDYKNFLFLGDQDRDTLERELQRPSIQLPLIFLVEYSLAKLWMATGVQPDALIGHSMGENTAACLSGVFSFDDALGLVLLRGQLMDDVPEGGMLSVQLPADDLRMHLNARLTIAAINSPSLSVVSGTKDDLASLSASLNALGIENKPVGINIAAHSWLLDGILKPFGDYLKNVQLNPPKIKFISNLTGTWITAQEATDPTYWVQHLRNTVRFSEGIQTLLATKGRIFLEVGPGNTLSSLTRQHPTAPTQRVFSSLRHYKEETPDDSYFLTVHGRLWAVGYHITTSELWPKQKRRRLPLPTYAFNHQAYWIPPGKPAHDTSESQPRLKKIDNVHEWFRTPVWIPQGALPQRTAPQTWLVFLDESGIGKEVVQYLRSQNHHVVTVSESDAYYQVSNEEYRLSPESGLEAYTALIKDLIACGRFPDRVIHLWLLTQDEGFRPGSSFIHRNMDHGFYSLFFLARAIADEGMIDREMHWLVYANGMQQVNQEAISYPEKAAVLGPCKVLPREFPSLTCASFDIALPQRSRGKVFFGRTSDGAAIPSELLTLIKRETSVPPANGVFAYREGVRWQLHYDHVDIDDQQPRLPKRLFQNGVYLITGGLGGIGFEVAKELARQYQARLALVNRTPLPPRGEWADWLRTHEYDDRISQSIKKLQQLESQGAQVTVYSGDVIDRDRMRDIVRQITTQYGSIQGVIHAAGTLRDSLVQMKNQGEVEEVFAPKIYGTLVLDEIFEHLPLDFFVVFSSISTAIAPVGQIDYVAANAFLNAYAQSRNSTSNRYTLSVNWGVWNEVGMAAASAARMGYANSKSVGQETTEARYPLFELHTRSAQNGSKLHSFTLQLQAQQDWVLNEHRTKAGQAILPGTAYIELARAALQECGETQVFEICDLIFLKALYVPDGQTVSARVKLEQTVEGYDFFLQSEVVGASGVAGWQTHAQARVIMGLPVANARDSLDSILARHQLKSPPRVESPHTLLPALRTRQESHLRFGPRWHVLRQVDYQADAALAFLELAEPFRTDLEEFKLHPGLLDIATGFAMDLIEGYSDVQTSTHLWVPVSYGGFQYHRPLNSRIIAWVRNASTNRNEDEFVSFDVTLFDERGNLLVEVKKLTLRKLSGSIDVAAEDSQSQLERSASPIMGMSEFRQLSPAELAFQHNLSQGILPSEGTAALFTALHHYQNQQVIITSLELEGLTQEVEASSRSLHQHADVAKFARPELDTEYRAPSDDIERTIVGFWEDLLGVERVGTLDNFFDLGGHSLVAVRLFAKIQQAYNLDFPISVLFEAPTIFACASMIRDALGSQTEQTNRNHGSQETAHRSRYMHLVPMHATQSSQLTPFFLVAGMFGNVLNLRHLAQLIGNERPFMGLQARGLFGDHEPHATFEDMAKDYISEMLTVQSKGPFILGGFSGGGITAFEISRQLTVMGHEVAELIFLDTPLPYNDPLSSVDRMSIHWQRLKTQGIGYFTQWAKNRYHWELEKFRKRFDNPDNQSAAPDEFKSGRMELSFYQALARYQIQPQNVKATLFRPKLPVEYYLSGDRMARQDRQIIMEDNGWSRYIKDLQVFEVPGDHDSMVLEPNVRILAAKLRQCIDTADPLRNRTARAYRQIESR